MKGKTRSQTQASNNSLKSEDAETEDVKQEFPSAPPATATDQIERGSPSESDQSQSPSGAPVSSHVTSGASHPSPPLTPATPSSRRSSSATNYIQGEGQGGPISHPDESNSGAGGANGETSYVTYVEGSDHSSIFVAAAAAAAASANGQTMSYPVYTVSEGTAAMFGNGAQYYSSSNAITYAQEGGVAYLVPSTANNSNSNPATNLDNDSQPNITHATRVSPATVQWLMDNYETAEGVSLPRSTLYYHYMRHCQEHKLDPVNAASFGKLIRSVFLGLRTRRLGTRGNSKYHYYGIRLKPTSPLNQFNEEAEQHQHHNSNGHPINAVTSPVNGSRHSLVQSTSPANNNVSPAKKLKISKSEPEVMNGISTSDAMSIQQYLGDPSHALEDFPELEFSAHPDGLTPDDFLLFRSYYREHCELLLEDILNFQLAEVDKRWKSFWRAAEVPGVEAQQFDNIIPRSKLQLLCSTKGVQHFVRDADYLFYQSIVTILLPDVLRPIPSTMTQAIRNFAKGLEGNLASAMVGLPDDMITIKVTIVNSLAQTLRRYTSLNHLAQAARAVLQNQAQISQMLSDLNRVDFHNVEEQAAWVCGCDGDLVPDLEADFKATLAQQQSLEQWAHWLEGVVSRILRPHLASGNFLKVARNFLLKWSFYSSLIIRDLTLRSAASFGSFHLLRLLYDEYMFYLVEQKVAEVTGTVPIAVIGKRSLENNLPSTGDNCSSSLHLDAEDSQTQALVDRYIRDRQLNQTSASELHSGAHPPSNGINGNGGSTSDESSGESSSEVHQSSNHAVEAVGKSTAVEVKRRKNFLIV